jgi:hypothetical protein
MVQMSSWWRLALVPCFVAACDSTPSTTGDDARNDATRTDGPEPTLDFDALVEGSLHAAPRVSREVIRMPASDAPATDSQTQLVPHTAAPIAYWRWRVWPSDAAAGADAPATRYDARVFESYDESPTFTCPDARAAYDVELTVSDGTVRSSFRFRRMIVCTLPRTTAGRTVLDVDLAAGSTAFCNGSIRGTAVAPGTLVRVSGTINQSWSFWNLTGTVDAPIHIINSGKVVNTNAAKLLHCYNCQHVIIDGLGDDAHPYGIELSNTSSNASQAVFFKTYADGTCANTELRGLADLELFGVHVIRNRNDASTAGGAGIEVNTRGDTEGATVISRDTGYEVTGDPATGRPGVAIHHNKVEDTYVEGFYIGFTVDWDSATYDDTVAPYQMRGVKVFRNTIRATGKDGLQVCNARQMEVHDNHVSDVAVRDLAGDQSSFQVNSGSEGAVFANHFLGGRGLNMQSGCTGDDLFMFGNVVERGVQAPGNSLYFKAGITADVHAHLFLNTFSLGTDAFFALNTADPGCNADNGALAGLYITNNLFVMPDAALLYRTDGGSAPALKVESPNVRRPSASDVCLGADGAVCDTSAALAQTGVDLTTVGKISTTTLPLGAITDLSGRVVGHLRGHGARQVASP